MAEKMYFGVLGNIQEIPAPKSGMGVNSNIDAEVTELVSGGRSIFRSPTAYKTFNMSWSTTADRLRHIIAMYNGQFGSGPFYIADPTVDQENVLPPRWANSWQLAHQANGWCRPTVEKVIVPTTPTPDRYHTDRSALFTQAAAGSSVKLEGVVRTRVIRVPGKPYYFSADLESIGGAGVKLRGYNQSTGTWTTLVNATSSVYSNLYVAAENTTTTMLELDLYMPLGSTLRLYGLALGTKDHFLSGTDWMPAGTGIGPVNFADSTSGELVSSTIDRIGLSLDFTEVESIEG